MISSTHTGNDYSASYFYNAFRGNHLGDTLPPQMIPLSQKTQKWKEDNMDILESIGIKQFRENLKFKDFYTMVRGEMVYSDYVDIPPQLREIQRLRENFEIPTTLRHHDILGIITNALTGEYMRNIDKFTVTNTDEFASNEFERTKSQMLHSYVQEELNKELKIALIRQGLDPDRTQFNSQEEQIAYIEEVRRKQNEMTPPEIENFMKMKWTTMAAKWGEHTLENDRERFVMDEMTRNEFRDYLLTGRCFRHHLIGYDYYRPESWSPINTFYSKDLETKYVQKGEYAGRVHFFTPSQVVNRYGHKLSESQKKDLVGTRHYNQSHKGDLYGSGSIKNAVYNNFNQRVIAPHEQFLDHAFITNLQDELGIPMATTTVKDKFGKEVTTPSFFPRLNSFSTLGNNSSLAYALSNGARLRTDLIQVTEAYWMSSKRIGYLTYRTESGRFTTELVTEELLKDFLKEKGIKQVTTATIEQVEKDPKKYENTIVWDYIPVVRFGVKINPAHSYLKKPIYLDMEETEVQLRGDSNVYDTVLPVSGYIGESLGLKIKPDQIGHNIAMNQMTNILEKEVGLFWLFDINFLPSEFKEFGDTEETLMHMREFARDIGFFPVDTRKQNTGNAALGNQMLPINMSLSSQIADRMSVANFYKQQAFDKVGITQQRLATPTKHETAEGVRQNADASFAQTEVYFSQFSDYLRRTYEIHLNIAQYAQRNGKDISVFFTKSDMTQAFLKFQDENFQNRKLGIMVISNSKKRKELETFKTFLLNNNTMTSDVLSFATLLTSDSIVELIDIARQERIRSQEQAQVDHERAVELLEKEAELEEQAKINEFNREESSKEKDRANKIEVERIESLGRAVDNDSAQEKLNFINQSADIALKKEKGRSDFEIANKKLDLEDKGKAEDRRIKMAELKLRAQELRERRADRQSDQFIATVNKN